MDYGLWTMDYGLWTMDYGLWTIRTVAGALWTMDCEDRSEGITTGGVKKLILPTYWAWFCCNYGHYEFNY